MANDISFIVYVAQLVRLRYNQFKIKKRPYVSCQSECIEYSKQVFLLLFFIKKKIKKIFHSKYESIIFVTKNGDLRKCVRDMAKLSVVFVVDS